MPEAYPYKTRPFDIAAARLIESEDPATIGDNFQELVNLRPTLGRKKAIGGMTKITSTALTFNDVSNRAAKIRNAIHFVKEEPYESHIVVEAYNYLENSLKIYSLDGDVPDADDFGTVLYTVADAWTASRIYSKGSLAFPTTNNGYYYECIDGGSAGLTEPTWPTTEFGTVTDNAVVWICRKGSLHGAFSTTDTGELIYASNHILLVWPGNEHKIGAVINASRNAWPLPLPDYPMFEATDRMMNTLVDDENVLIITGVDNHPGSPSHYDTDIYLGSPFQLSGAKFYIQNPVGYSPATLACDTDYWKDGGFSAVTNTDGTAVSGKTLSQTGTIGFNTDTVGLAKPTLAFGRILYWYRFRFHGVPTSGVNRPIVYFITTIASMQPMTDIWDGTPVPIIAAWKNPSADKYFDVAVNIANVDDVQLILPLSTSPGYTWAHTPGLVLKLDSFSTSDRLYLASLVPLCGFKIVMAKSNTSNTERNTNNAVIAIEYFNGQAFTAAADVRDGTAFEGKSLWQSGIIAFTPPDREDEFKTCINNDSEFYYYQVYWDHALDSDVVIDQILGIPAPSSLKGHSRAFTAQGRLFLVEKNNLSCSPVNRPTVHNGSEHASFNVGNEKELTGGCQLFNIQGSDYKSPILIFKRNATYLLSGTGPSWQRHDLSMFDGLAAPDTLCVINLPISIPGMASTVAIGQGTNCVWMCDGRPPRPISQDISQYFDTRHADCIPSDMLDKSVGFIDHENLEYHWLFASGSGQTTLNKEMVFSFKNPQKVEWFEVNRENSILRFGLCVMDRNEKRYTYGMCDDGYVKRLEYGTTFDGEDISCIMWPGDITMIGDKSVETKVESAQLTCVAKETTARTIGCAHYCDTSLTAMKPDLIEFAPQAAGKRIANIIAKFKTPSAIFHSSKFLFTCEDEDAAFEPIDLLYHYTIEQQRVRPSEGTSIAGKVLTLPSSDQVLTTPDGDAVKVPG